MVVAVNRIFVKKEFQKEFEARFQDRGQLVEQQPGWIRTEILCPTEGDDYLVITWWRSKEDFER